jgi:hypothetical protein
MAPAVAQAMALLIRRADITKSSPSGTAGAIRWTGGGDVPRTPYRRLIVVDRRFRHSQAP